MSKPPAKRRPGSEAPRKRPPRISSREEGCCQEGACEEGCQKAAPKKAAKKGSCEESREEGAKKAAKKAAKQTTLTSAAKKLSALRGGRRPLLKKRLATRAPKNPLREVIKWQQKGSKEGRKEGSQEGSQEGTREEGCKESREEEVITLTSLRQAKKGPDSSRGLRAFLRLQYQGYETGGQDGNACIRARRLVVPKMPQMNDGLLAPAKQSLS